MKDKRKKNGKQRKKEKKNGKKKKTERVSSAGMHQ